MGKDIKMKDELIRFKYRVAGIVEYENKVLIVKMNKNDFFCFPGGHVELMETSLDALKRELKEELYFDVKIKELFCINENFFYSDIRHKNYHELCFYYLCEPSDENFVFEDRIIEENDKNSIVYHNFKWVEKNKLIGYNIKPEVILDNYLKNSKFLHLITKWK